jgi:hypothetical protein
MVLAPAWDFDRDGWLHSRMAVVRGVESGLAVARVARGGLATVSDAYGRVTAESETAQGVTLNAVVPVPDVRTSYSRFGGWFAWCWYSQRPRWSSSPPSDPSINSRVLNHTQSGGGPEAHHHFGTAFRLRAGRQRARSRRPRPCGQLFRVSSGT